MIQDMVFKAFDVFERIDGGEPQDPENFKHYVVLGLWLKELRANNPPQITRRHRAAILAALVMQRHYAQCELCDEYRSAWVADAERTQYWLDTTGKQRRKRAAA